MAVDWSKVPAGKSYLDRRTIGGEVKYWDPDAIPIPFTRGGSWQSQGALDTKRKQSGEGPISQTPAWKKASWNKNTPTPPKPQPTYAERTRAEREALQVVKGGQSGYKSLMPKPTAQKGETAQAFDARIKRYEKSQSLATRLTAQLKANRPPAVPPVAADPQDSTTTPPPAPPRRPTTQIGRTGEIDPKTKLPVYNHYEVDGEENLNEVLAKKGNKWVDIQPDKSQIEVSPSQTAIDRYNRLLQQRSQQQSRPAAVPFSKSVPAPAAADLDKYKINKDWAAANPRLAQAQVARASGQPRADINKILYKPGTAAYGAAGKSEMEKQVDQMRQDREKMAKQREADKVGPRAQSALPGGAYSPTATANMTQRTRNILGVKEQHDAYDLVLEYLLSEGHVDTVDEAHYVMMQMDAGYIQSIVEVSGELFRGIFNPNNSAASNVQKTSPFNRPVTPLPSIVSPFARPASRNDSGKLTPYGAGGGAAAELAGQTRTQVMQQGAKNLENLENKKLKPVNQGPDFGR